MENQIKELECSIIDDISYRNEMLSTIKKNCIIDNITKIQSDLIINYAPVSIYAIFEGFFVKTMELFINFINHLSFKQSELLDSIINNHLVKEYKLHELLNNPEKQIKKTIEIKSFFDQDKVILSNKIETKSNVNLKVINNNFKIYGISQINNKDLDERLNKLVNIRNIIAHGEDSISLDINEITELTNTVTDGMDILFDTIIESIKNKCFLNLNTECYS